jgi:hypothetical protein
MGVHRPDWWYYPERCQNEREWGPGLITVSWVLCDCPPAMAARERAGGGPAGHMAVFCNAGAALPVGVVPAAALAGHLRAPLVWQAAQRQGGRLREPAALVPSHAEAAGSLNSIRHKPGT